jgi:RNA polymerase sigma-70 factor (ECF subfamily)
VLTETGFLLDDVGRDVHTRVISFCKASDRFLSRFDKPLPVMTEESKKSVSDYSLLNRFRSGDEDAALQLYFRYAERLLKLAKRETPQELATRFDPEDIVQSVFRTFFRRAASGQYEAPEGDELWKLLLVMALNKVRGRGAYHRADKRDIRRTQPIPDSDAGVVVARNAGGGDNNEEARNILCLSVEEIISNQPESHRAVIRLRIDGMEVQEIALKEQRSKRTVERILQSFRKELIESALLSVGEAAE